MVATSDQVSGVDLACCKSAVPNWRVEESNNFGFTSSNFQDGRCFTILNNHHRSLLGFSCILWDYVVTGTPHQGNPKVGAARHPVNDC